MQNLKKLITIVIPTINRSLFVKKILSEIKYFNKKLDIIIVDDHSKKNESDILFKFSRNFKNVKYFRLIKNRGQSYACNFGLKISNTKYIWFFDDDDFLSRKTLSKVITFLSKNNPDGILLPMKQIYKNKVINFVNPTSKDHLFNKLRNQQQRVSTSCAIFNTKKILKINGWDEKLFGGTDTDLFLRFSKNNIFDVLKTNPVIVNFSVSNRVTNKFLRQQKAKIFFLKKHWKILTLKRRIYYIISFILCFSLLNSIKSKLKSIY